MKIRRSIRRFFYTNKIKIKVGSYIKPLYVNGSSTVTKKTFLGKNVHFNGMKIGGCGEVHIGNNFHSGTECSIITQNHNYEGAKIPYDNTYICKKIVIENNVWIGHQVIILPGIRIGEGAIIQAGAVVSCNIPAYSIAGGNPAKTFSFRDEVHYNKLKKEEKFL